MTADISLFHRAGPLGKIVALLNVGLIFALPLSWFLPLTKQSAWVGISKDFTIFEAVVTLLRDDIFLFCVVFGFGVVAPFVKTLLYCVIWFRKTLVPPSLYKIGGLMSKLSMIDIFVVTLVILMIKGLGVATVTPLFGIYYFSALVLISFLISVVTDLVKP